MKSFEELKNTWVWIGDNPELSILVQKRLISLGFTWGGNEGGKIKYVEKRFLAMGNDDPYLYYGQGRDSSYAKERKEVTIADIGISGWVEVGDNPELCKRVQERLFEMGYGWNSGGKRVQLEDSILLCIREDGRFTRTRKGEEEYAESYKAREGTDKEITLSMLGISEPVKINESKVSSLIPLEAETKTQLGSKYKVGDVVFLPRYGKHAGESCDWAKEESLPLNKPLKISGLQQATLGCDGIQLEGRRYTHPSEKFRPISELKWRVKYTPALDRYLIAKYGQVDSYVLENSKEDVYVYSSFNTGFFAPSYVSLGANNAFMELSESEFLLIANFLYPESSEYASSEPIPEKDVEFWRFKTEEEFISEFGKNWREKGELDWAPGMDLLFGEQFKRGETNIDSGRIEATLRGASKNIYWKVNEKMVTNKPIVSSHPITMDEDMVYLGLYTQTETPSSSFIDRVDPIYPPDQQALERRIIEHYRRVAKVDTPVLHDLQTERNSFSGYEIEWKKGRKFGDEEISLINTIFERPNILTITD